MSVGQLEYLYEAEQAIMPVADIVTQSAWNWPPICSRICHLVMDPQIKRQDLRPSAHLPHEASQYPDLSLVERRMAAQI